MGALAEALAGGGAWIKWDDIGMGTQIAGTVVDVQIRQARKFQSTDLDFWDDGSPKMQAVITLSNPTFRDPEDPEDKGIRNVSVNLWNQKGGSGQKSALTAACKLAGVAEPTPGDTFAATWLSGVGKSTDPRMFAYVITPGSGLGGQLSDTPQGYGVSVGTVPAAPAPAAAAEESKPDKVKRLASLGLSHADIADATGYSPEAVAALLNL